MASVGVQEVLVGELGDCTRLTTGFFAVCGVREESLAHRIVEHAIRVREGALHLVEDNAVVAQVALLISLKVPTFLLKDALALIDCRMQNGV